MTAPPESDLGESPPAARMIGKEILAVDEASGEVQLKFLARLEFSNRHGTVGDEFLAAMLDSTAAAPLLATLPSDLSAVTTKLNIDFLRPAQTGEIFGLGRLVNLNERDAECRAEVSMPDGTVVAQAHATFRVVRRRERA